MQKLITCAVLLIFAAPSAWGYRDFSDSEITKVIMLGSGTPMPDPTRSGPAVAVVVNDIPYLVDAGEGVWRATGAATPDYGGIVPGLAGARLSRLFLTHLHSDHTVGLPSIILSPWTLGRRTPLAVYGPPGTGRMVGLILEAYSEDIAIRRYSTTQTNDYGWRATGHDIMEPGTVYTDDNVKVEAFPTAHSTWPRTYAYRFTTPDRRIVISGDTRPTRGIIDAATDADILIHEVIGLDDRDKQPWGKSKTKPIDFGDVAGYFHTTTAQLAEIAKATRPRLLVLYHEQNWSSPYVADALVTEIHRFGYDGKIISSQDQDIY